MEIIKSNLSTIKNALRNAVNHYSDHNTDYVYYDEDGKGYHCYAINKYDDHYIHDLKDQCLTDLYNELYSTNLVAVKKINNHTLILLIADSDFKDTEYKYYLYSRVPKLHISNSDDEFYTEYETIIINIEE